MKFSFLRCIALSTGWMLILLTVLFHPVSVNATGSVAEVIPNDPYWSHQWYLRQIHAPAAWSATTGSASVIVAVLDTGIDITHPDIRENIWTNTKEIPDDQIDNDRNGYVDDVHGWSFVNNTPAIQPVKTLDQSLQAYSHGTAVASLIGARGNDGVGIAGVAWNVRIMPLVVLDADGSGHLDGLLNAIRYAVNQGAQIINLSLAGVDYDENLDQLMRRVAQANVLIVVATGNDPRTKTGLNLNTTPVYPACMDGNINAVLGVSGTDTLDQKAPYANAGSACTDLSAPAQQIFAARPIDTQTSTTFPGYFPSLTGTSLAAPLVSGVAALIKSLQPTWTAQQIRDRLIATADPVEDSTVMVPGRLGAGRLNAAKALEGLIPAPVSTSSTPLFIASTTSSTSPVIKKSVKKSPSSKIRLKKQRIRPVISLIKPRWI